MTDSEKLDLILEKVSSLTKKLTALKRSFKKLSKE